MPGRCWLDQSGLEVGCLITATALTSTQQAPTKDRRELIDSGQVSLTSSLPCPIPVDEMQVTITMVLQSTYVDEILVNFTGSLCTSIIPASESQCSVG